jgi:hypothetical protein
LQQKNEQLSLFNDKLVAGSLSMTSLKIGWFNQTSDFRNLFFVYCRVSKR